MKTGLRIRIKEQISVGETLKHYWRNFGSYERWRQVKSGNFWPRIWGVMDFLEQHANHSQEVSSWMASHMNRLEEAFEGVASMYAEAAARQVNQASSA